MIAPPTTSLGNLSSLDITNDEELPTDPSNSSDTQEESECRGRDEKILVCMVHRLETVVCVGYSFLD